MSQPPPAHDDRRRAESFGSAAAQYDRHRPRYPRVLIAGLITRPHMRVLDVGAGTGIASVQMRDAGADVLAVEPDERMARVATAKGITVQCATLEEWRPVGGPFDLVVFAQSFHWVHPHSALAKIATLLSPDGQLALLANRVIPTAPTQQQLDEINADYLDVAATSVVNNEESVATMLEQKGFSVEVRRCSERLHYSTEDYLDLVFTYSNRLALDPAARTELRSRLERRIGPAGVAADNHALAIVCTPRR